MNKILIAIIIVAAVVGVGAFYGGMKYSQSRALSVFSQSDFQGLRNLSPQERQQQLQQFGANFGGTRIGNRMGINSVIGEIIAKDEQSITVKLPDAGSKIIFFSDSTNIMKSVEGSKNDLMVGEQIVISGEENSDGSYIARTIDVRRNRQ